MQLQEFMQEFERMCRFYKRENDCPMSCPMLGVNISQCRKVVFEQPEEAERIVQTWCKYHPKPMTWREWLGAHNIIVRSDGSLHFLNPSDEEKPVPEALWKI